MAKSDNELVVRACRGEEDAYGELFKRYFPYVYRIAIGYTHDADDAKDVTQETFIRAFRKLEALRKHENFKSWISRICRNTALNQLQWRKSRGEIKIPEAIDRFLYVPPEEEKSLREHEMEIVRQVIEEIPKTDIRETVRFFYSGKGTTIDKIAAKQGIPVSTVTTRLDRFRAKYKGLIMKRILELRKK